MADFITMDSRRESDTFENGVSGETLDGEANRQEKLEALAGVRVPFSRESILETVSETSPESYRLNSDHEKSLLAIADNFHRQYTLIYPDHKPLLFCPLNECGVKKFVSTTLRPTAPTYPELLTWEGCSSFVADFLSLELLEPPIHMPRYMFSPTSVLQNQRGNCFEFATVLCSLLLGANYDAYCVSGYATREMCLLDQSHHDCHLLNTMAEAVTSDKEPSKKKISWNPQKELKSRFLEEQERKKQEAEAILLQGQLPQTEIQPVPVDPFHGLRIHCWVLVLSGCQNIQENFFIDPLTGKRYSTTADEFLGIESVWNNFNYYVNVQDRSNGCTDMVFDLDDIHIWEPVLYGATGKKQRIAEFLKKMEEMLITKFAQEDEKEEEVEKEVFEMPSSWVRALNITKRDLVTRWPGGSKATRYRKADLETFAPYLRSDGLVTRLTLYKDLDCTEVVKVKEWYQHRLDHLVEKEVNKVDNFTSECFTPGRSFHLLFHRYKSHTMEREMEFNDARLDGLVRRVESLGEMTETFEGRKDFLYHRHTVFDRHVQFSNPDVTSEERTPPLLKVVERFHRNRKKPAREDVAERTFALAQRLIEVTYHLEDQRFIPSKRSFISPRKTKGFQKAQDFTADMVFSFQVDQSDKRPTTVALYEMLVALMRDEEEVALQIQASKREVRDIVACRIQEDTDVKLEPSPWTNLRASGPHSQGQETLTQYTQSCVSNSSDNFTSDVGTSRCPASSTQVSSLYNEASSQLPSQDRQHSSKSQTVHFNS